MKKLYGDVVRVFCRYKFPPDCQKAQNTIFLLTGLRIYTTEAMNKGLYGFSPVNTALVWTMYKKGTGNDKQVKDAGKRTLCPYRNFSQAISEN